MLLGVNLAGAEFNPSGTRGVNSDYVYPLHSEIDYFASKGLDVIRLPFLWERLQPTMNGPLSTKELSYIDDVVAYANSKGMKVILDVHNFGYGYGYLVGSADTPNTAFADLWGKIGAHFADNTNVMFGLMNEPHVQSASDWLESANAATAAIRASGATSQTILVPGSYWDGAWTWVSSDNDSVIGKGIEDPSHNFAFEVHQYLDADGSGTHAGVVSESVGAERLTGITQWAEETANKLFLGEFGVAKDSTSLSALDGMLSYMTDHTDTWLGGTYWAAGPWWGDYMFSVEPKSGVDKPQFDVLEKFVSSEPDSDPVVADQDIELIYVAYFGRAADPAGLSSWVANLDSGQDIFDVALNFAKSDEAQNLYSFLASPTTDNDTFRTSFINTLYQDLFNRDAEGTIGDAATGLGYWNARLEEFQEDLSDGVSGSDAHGNLLNARDFFNYRVGNFVLQVALGAQGADTTTLENKTEVAQYFTEQVITNNIDYDGLGPSNINDQAHQMVDETTSINLDTQLDAVDHAMQNDIGSSGQSVALTNYTDCGTESGMDQLSPSGTVELVGSNPSAASAPFFTQG
jgi:aryl-phospho-beta-D-glucosidase BglC (GH1 family)